MYRHGIEDEIRAGGVQSGQLAGLVVWTEGMAKKMETDILLGHV